MKIKFENAIEPSELAIKEYVDLLMESPLWETDGLFAVVDEKTQFMVLINKIWKYDICFDQGTDFENYLYERATDAMRECVKKEYEKMKSRFGLVRGKWEQVPYPKYELTLNDVTEKLKMAFEMADQQSLLMTNDGEYERDI